VLERDELLAEAITVLRSHLDRTQPWRLDALCREPAYRTGRFFPERGESAEPARAVCARCPVAVECGATVDSSAAWAGVGIWGGLSGRERRTVRRDGREVA
jgi:WhiB family redox-sensing transcriptional regulator